MKRLLLIVFLMVAPAMAQEPVPGLPPVEAVPAPIAPLVLPAPYSPKPFISGDTTRHLIIGGSVAVGVPLTIAVIQHFRHKGKPRTERAPHPALVAPRGVKSR